MKDAAKEALRRGPCGAGVETDADLTGAGRVERRRAAIGRDREDGAIGAADGDAGYAAGGQACVADREGRDRALLTRLDRSEVVRRLVDRQHGFARATVGAGVHAQGDHDGRGAALADAAHVRPGAVDSATGVLRPCDDGDGSFAVADLEDRGLREDQDHPVVQGPARHLAVEGQIDIDRAGRCGRALAELDDEVGPIVTPTTAQHTDREDTCKSKQSLRHGQSILGRLARHASPGK